MQVLLGIDLTSEKPTEKDVKKAIGNVEGIREAYVERIDHSAVTAIADWKDAEYDMKMLELRKRPGVKGVKSAVLRTA